jgi:pyruvate dehydrogenase E2 component (dihydrolipoamide acetyltransferase)
MSDSIVIVLPDIGDYKDVPVVEINVSVGDDVSIDTPLLSIESDKATMEVPSPAAGKVKELKIGVGTRVSQGTTLMIIEGRQEQVGTSPPMSKSESLPPRIDESPTPTTAVPPAIAPAAAASTKTTKAQQKEVEAHASPSVRALARELGVQLELVVPSGPKSRIVRDDVFGYVKNTLSAKASISAVSGNTLLEWPRVEFEKFGPVERMPLSRIQKMTGANLSRNWSVIPHVTNFDKADVTEGEAFRKIVNGEATKDAAKLTMVSILIKAAALALKKYPRFNSSLEGDDLVLKNYFHVGFAVDTPKGLVVPVIRDCDTKGLQQIASEMRALADKAIDGRLVASDMQGGCFSVSSLGGVGGNGFTPIINAPEVAILGAGRATIEAIWNGHEFEPRLILPLNLSWDHRVVDGVAGAKFLGFIAAVLGDMRRYAL